MEDNLCIPPMAPFIIRKKDINIAYWYSIYLLFCIIKLYCLTLFIILPVHLILKSFYLSMLVFPLVLSFFSQRCLVWANILLRFHRHIFYIEGIQTYKPGHLLSYSYSTWIVGHAQKFIGIYKVINMGKIYFFPSIIILLSYIGLFT